MTATYNAYQTVHINSNLLIHATHILLSQCHFILFFFSTVKFVFTALSVFTSHDSDYSNTILLRINLPRCQTQHLQPLAESPEATPWFPGPTA